MCVIQLVLIGVGALWPLIAFAGGLGYSPLVAFAALLSLPLTLPRLRPQIYMIAIVAFLGFAGASIIWSPREIAPFDIDLRAFRFAVRYEVYRLGLTLIWSAILISAAGRLSGAPARRVVSIATWSIGVQLVVVAALILLADQAVQLSSMAGLNPGETVQNIARNGIILALAAPFLIVGFGRQLSFSRALVVEVVVFAMVVGVLAMGDVIGPILSVGVGLAAVAVVRLFPRSGFKLIGFGVAGYVMAAPFLFSILAAGAVPASVTNSINWRLAIWKHVIDQIQKSPLTGHGLGAYRAMEEAIPVGPFAGRLALHPHNMALQIWTETGLFGAAIFALLILVVAFRMPAPRRLGVAGLLAAALAGQFLAIGLSFDLWNDWLWACAGILTALFVAMARAEAIDDPSRLLAAPSWPTH